MKEHPAPARVTWTKGLTRRELLRMGLLGGMAFGLGGGGLLEGCARKRPGKLPNIIVLTVDTLRADHLALYGYPRDTMPVIGSFAESAVVFDNAIVPRGSTCPSYASMLTGLYPFHHGIYYEGHLLSEDLVTLPEILKSAGYHTAAFVSNFALVGRLFGADKVFDIYDDYMDELEGSRPNYERTAANTTKAILEWLESDPPQPFLLFTNFIDPHGPYNPPERLRGLFKSDRKRMLRPGQIPSYQRLEGALDYYDYIDRYDEEARYVDDCMGVLIEEFEGSGLWEDALVIFTADHGESFGEHGIFFEHQLHLWEETTRVPLAIRLPSSELRGERSRPARVSTVCSPMDMMPTILDYLGLDGPETDALSLLPALRGRPDEDRMIFLEFPSDRLPWDFPDIYAMRSAAHKLVRIYEKDSREKFRQAIFDVSADPLEQRPIEYDDRSPVHRRLSEELDAMVAESREYELPFPLVAFRMSLAERKKFVEKRKKGRKIIEKRLSEEDLDRLRSLGYVQ